MLGKLTNRNGLALALLLLILILCNFAFPGSAGWARLGWNVLGYGGLFLVYKTVPLSLKDIGLSKAEAVNGLKYAGLCIIFIAVFFVSAFLIHKQFFYDQRYNQSIAQALYTGLLLVPSKTIIFEELAFRGLMPALLKKIKNNQWFIAGVSSGLFGLWHIASAPKSGDFSVGHPSDLSIIAIVFITTTIAGLFFYLLRQRSKSLLAPILVHWFINSFSIFIAALSWMRY